MYKLLTPAVMDQNHSSELCLQEATYFIVVSFLGLFFIVLFIVLGLVLGLVGQFASKKSDSNVCWGCVSAYVQLLTAKSLSTFLSVIGVEVRYNSASARPIKFRVVDNKYKISVTDIIPLNVPTFHIEDRVYTIESSCLPVVLPLASLVLVEYFAVVIVSLMKTTYECNDKDQFCYSVGCDCGLHPLDCTVWEEHNRTSHLVCVDKYPDFIHPILTLLSILGLTIVLISLSSCIFNEKCTFLGPKLRILFIGFFTGVAPSILAWIVYGNVYMWQFGQIFRSPDLAIFTIILSTEFVLLILPIAVFKESELEKIELITTGTVRVGRKIKLGRIEINSDAPRPWNVKLHQEHPTVKINNSKGIFTLKKEPNAYKLTFVPAQNGEQIGGNNQHIVFKIHSNTHTITKTVRKIQKLTITGKEVDFRRSAYDDIITLEMEGQLNIRVKME